MLRRFTEPSRPVPRALGILKGSVACAFLFSLLGLTNVVQMLSGLFWPVSPRLTRSINRRCAHLWWGICVFVMEKPFHTRIVFSGDRLPPRENAIVLSNHQQMSDIPLVMSLAWRKGRLGDLKWIVKEPLKYVPGIGWGMLFLGCIFVKRQWAEDKESVERAFAHLNRNRVPVWLVMFPEGTRITSAKLERSKAFAQKTGLKPLDDVLLPRTKGFAASVQGLRGHAGAVYDLTLGFPTGIPTLWQLFKGEVREAHVHMRRFPMSVIPEDSDAASDWLMQRFVEKDRLMRDFRATGKFPGPVLEEPYWQRPGSALRQARQE